MTNDDAAPVAGTGSLGRFEILRTLGIGGMGVVYEAFDRERQVRVALKTLPMADPQALYRFKQEFRLLAGITHPNLATLYELIADDDRWCLTMEVVDGVDFLSHVRSARPGSVVMFPAPAARPEPDSAVDSENATATAAAAVDGRATEGLDRLLPGPPTGTPLADFAPLKAALRQLAGALLTLHAERRLHCDIKPSNVLVDAAARVVVLDFGLAAELGPRTGLRAADEPIFGTAAYMAPEQALGAPLTPACDWYAVGSMLYEALTGRRPFGGTPHEMLLAKQTRLPPSPRHHNPRVPEALDRICLRLMAPSPAQRADGAALLDALAAPGSHPPDTASGATALVGRKPHLETLRAAFKRAATGSAVAVFVHAPSGTGKTALIESFAARLSERGRALVLSGRCYEQESVQYKALDSLIDALARHLATLASDDLQRVLPADAALLARMFPVLERLPAVGAAPRDALAITSKQELRDRATSVLRRLLHALAASKPLVLCLDDLQWGDADSAAIILGLLAPPEPPPLLLVCAYRREHEQTSVCVRTLLAARLEPVERVDLAVDQLEPADAEELAVRLLGPEVNLGAPVAPQIARESRGNPYFVRALVEHVRAEAQFTSGEVMAEGISLDEVLRRRVSRLRPAARRLLEAVALAGRPLTEADAYAAADLGVRDPALLVALRNGHLLRSGADQTLEAYRDRIRESVVAQLPAPSLQSLHRRLATTLEARGSADPEWLGAHFEGAGEAATAARHYAQAADVAATALAFERAAELYRRSLALGSGNRWHQQSLRVRLADTLANGGRSLDAAEIYKAAAAETGGADGLEFARKAGYQLCIGGALHEGRALLAASLRRIGITLPRSARRALPTLLLNEARLRWLEMSGRLKPLDGAAADTRETRERLDLIWAAAASLTDVDVLVAHALQGRHLLEAIRSREPGRIAAAMALQTIASAHQGTPARARTLRLLDLAQRFADRVGTPYARAMTLLAQSTADANVHRWEAACRGIDEAEDLLRRHCTGVAWELSLSHMLRLALLRTQGEYGAMLRFSRAVLGEARQRGDLFTQARLGIMVEPDGFNLADEPLQARAAIRRIRREWLRGQFPTQQILACFAEVTVDIYRRNGAAAWRRISRYWPFIDRSLLLRMEILRFMAYPMRAGAALQAIDACPADARGLIRAAERDAGCLERERGEHGRITAQLIRAAIAAHGGDRARAVELLSTAATWYEREGMSAFLASTQRYVGLLTGGLEGRRLIADADGWFRAQGARNPARMAGLHVPGFPRSLEESESA